MTEPLEPPSPLEYSTLGPLSGLSDQLASLSEEFLGVHPDWLTDRASVVISPRAIKFGGIKRSYSWIGFIESTRVEPTGRIIERNCFRYPVLDNLARSLVSEVKQMRYKILEPASSELREETEVQSPVEGDYVRVIAPILCASDVFLEVSGEVMPLNQVRVFNYHYANSLHNPSNSPALILEIDIKRSYLGIEPGPHLWSKEMVLYKSKVAPWTDPS